MFNAKHHFVEYLWIVSIEKNIDIGISFKYKHNDGNVDITGIHVDKQRISQQHKLISPTHHCHCLDDFCSYITNLRIFGNTDELLKYKQFIQSIADVNVSGYNIETVKQWKQKAHHLLSNSSSSPMNICVNIHNKYTESCNFDNNYQAKPMITSSMNDANISTTTPNASTQSFVPNTGRITQSIAIQPNSQQSTLISRKEDNLNPKVISEITDIVSSAFESCPMNLEQWLMYNKLSDLQRITGLMTLEGLLNLHEQDTRSICNVIGLESQQIDRLINALNQEKQQSLKTNGIGGQFGCSSNNDGDFPVLPLIIPNNCTYNPDTGKMTVHHDRNRNKLQAYKPALDFIRNISSKIATISIVGRARTGKSLVAGELYAPDRIPCPFDLGHRMDACTYGVWISAKPIKHPYQKDTVVLIVDVEGTGFHETNKQNDIQLMVVTLLISSYFIYNTKGIFNASALDEIKFVTELTERIQATPNDDSGEEFKKFFPMFMWLLRDVHLEPTIENKTVSVHEYFTQKVLKKERGFHREIWERQSIRTVFLQMFQKYDAFALPIPHSNKSVLQKLGYLPRKQLEKAFVEKLKVFCDNVMKEAHCKVLYSKKADATDYYIQCTGSHLAAWIEQCVESVNNPDKIPEISSMTEAVMANVYRESKNKAIKQYQTLLNDGLNKLRNNNDVQPLDKNEVIELHLDVLNIVLNETGQSLQIPEHTDIYANCNYHSSVANQQQIKMYNEFCGMIGHNPNDIRKIGEKGILYQVLTINAKLSFDFCNNWLNREFGSIIEPMLANPKQFEAVDVVKKFNELEAAFYSQCKGPAKDECWKQFKSKGMKESIQYFKKMKGFNMKLLKFEEEAAIQREKSRLLKQQIAINKQDIAQQQQLMQEEMKRMDALRKQEEEEYQKQIDAAEQRIKDMHSAQFNELADAMQSATTEFTTQVMKIKNNKTQQQMTMNMMSVMHQIANRPPPQPALIRDAGVCLIQ